MKRSRISLIPAAVVLVASFAIFLATRQFVQARDAERNLQALRQQYVHWRDTVLHLEAATRKNAPTASEPRETTHSSPSPALVSAPDGPTPSPSPIDDVDALHLRALQADAQLALDRLFRSLSLSPEQKAAITRRIADHNRTQLLLAQELPPEARGDPSHPAALAFKARLADAETRLRSDLERLLGAEDYQRYEQYQQTAPHWSRVRNLATELYATATPLTASQASDLARILIANATSANGRVAPTFTNPEAVSAQAAGILAPSQLEMWKALEERSALHAQLNRMLVRAKRTR